MKIIYFLLFIIIANLNICNFISKKNYDDFSIFYNIIINNRNYFILKPYFKSSFYKFISITISNPCNIYKRNIQRKYRYTYKTYIYNIFVIGNNKCKSIIYQESKIYKDILLTDSNNHYFNITAMFLKALYWIIEEMKFDYLVKWDDDIILNIPLLLLIVNSNYQVINYGGYFYNKTSICREKNRICYIPFKTYKYLTIPSFIASGMLILSFSTTSLINNFSKKYTNYVTRDDQYIGIMLKILLIKPLPLNKYYIRSSSTKSVTKLLAYHTSNNFNLFVLYNQLKLPDFLL